MVMLFEFHNLVILSVKHFWMYSDSMTTKIYKWQLSNQFDSVLGI